MAEEKKPKFDQSEYIRKYAKENYTRVSVVLNKQNDADIIEHLKPKPSKSEYIKKLIRKDMIK